MSVRLYVKLPKAPLEKEGVEKMFSDFEESFTTKLIRERKKKECRGFGFITVSTDEIADVFISKYNEKPFVYEGETFHDEEGKDFTLLIEKALPRTKKDEEGGGDDSNVETTANDSTVEIPSPTPNSSNKTTPKPMKKVNNTNNTNSNTNSPNSNPNPNPKTQNRKGAKSKSNKAVAVSESIQPDPRWANELNKLKEMFATQTSN
jgi:hypothetical protein